MGLPEEEVIEIFMQIIQAYQHIHRKKIVHRDLKPDNILFKTDPLKAKRIAIIDFGYCDMEEVPHKPQVYYNVGSPKYMSPEAYKNTDYSEKSDIWALGIIFYELLLGKTCDYGMSMKEYLELIQRCGVPVPNTIKPFYRKLLGGMLAYNPSARMGVTQVIEEISSFSRRRHEGSEKYLKKVMPEDELRLTL